MHRSTHATDRDGAPAPVARPERSLSDTVVAVRDLTCTYGSVTAVDGIDLDVARGELLALLGTNGAGKTTTLEVLEGHRRPDRGQVRVLGLDPARQHRRLAARVGTVLQHSGLPATLTPVELLRTWARLHPDVEVLAPDVVLARVGLEHRARVRCGALSGGEQRRLDLAVAISTRPELLFLDEPTNGMDPEARERTWALVRELLRVGTSIVLTTHYLEEAEQLADRIAILHRGRVAVAGTRTQLVAGHDATISAEVAAAAHLEVSDVSHVLHGALTHHRAHGATRLVVRTRALQADLTALLSWAEQHGIVLHDLRAGEASLAEVFHAVAGVEATGIDHTSGKDDR